MRSIHGGSEPSEVAALCAAAAALAAVDPVDWSDEQVRDGLSALLVAANQFDALLSGVAASFETRGLSQADGFRTARSWLEAFGRLSQGVATGYLRRGRLLRDLPALDRAARDGSVTPEHVRKVDDLADHVGIEKVKILDELLASLASTERPREFEQDTCQRIRAALDPDGPDPDPDAASRRCLHVSRVGSLVYLNGKLDLDAGMAFMTALDALCPPPSEDDTRTTPQRRADALTELATRNLVAGSLPSSGGVRPQVGILLTPQALVGARLDANLPTANLPTAGPSVGGDSPPSGQHPPDGLECAGIPLRPELPWNDWVGQVPTAIARRLACDCEVWRVVLDPATGLPLEVGRSHRIVPAWVRQALHARDRGCRWPGCGVPAAWTEVHHLLPWYLGGESNPDNGLLLCRYHHGLVHHERPDHKRWGITVDHRTGEVTITRPHGRPYELGPSRPHRPRDD